MSENILVVEYEPRYTDRVRQALTDHPFTVTFARDGEEAVKALDGEEPRLIVLSSVVPKIATTELIRLIRGRGPLQKTPILLTVSGYNGKSPSADAQRVGASDILPKPYSEGEFLTKVQQLLGVKLNVPAGLTSNEIFGDLVDQQSPAAPAAAPETRKPMASKQSDDVDKMLADTLAGVMPQKKKDAPAAGAPQKPKTQSGTQELDKLLSDTLSGTRKPTGAGTTPRPAVPTPPPTPPPATAAPPAAAKPVAPAPAAPPLEELPDRVPVSQPVLTPAAPAAVEMKEEEPADGVKFGQYVLIEKIATGGMAEVWKARMRGVEGFQKIVAIKKILPHLSDNQDFIEMFVDEAKLAAQLNHNNIIHIYDLGKIQSSYYIAMEYVDGFDLKTILKRGVERDQPLHVELALFVASKIASALDYAHRKRDFDEREMGLVHRDVSPQNVLISQEGDIKLCDFGIAKAASKASHTQAGALKGKLQYMSPEQAWGKHIDRRSDVFALAAVLFEMLTGRKLFTGDNEISILEQVREARVTAPSLYNDEVTPEIDKIVLKALHKDPEERYQSAGEMARDLDAVLYTFRPTPTSADLAIYMHRLSAAEPLMLDEETEPVHEAPRPVVVAAPAPAVAAPAVAARAAAAPAPAPVAAPTPAVSASAPFAAHAEEPKKGKGMMIGAAVALLAIVGAGAWYATRDKGATPAAAAGTTTAATAQPAATTTAPIAVDTAASAVATGTTATTATSPIIDASAVDQEVQRRLAAERARLAQQQQAVPAATPAQVRPTPAATATTAQAVPPPAQTQTVAPAPVQPPPTQTVAPQATETRAEPVREEPAAPAVRRAREGELVAPGTEGLTAPRVLRRGTVPYPPLAKAQRVQGTVIVNVLISETGQVLETRVLRGINRPVGLNEAAEQAMRRSTFAPGMKDGVRVRTWLSVPVEFTL